MTEEKTVREKLSESSRIANKKAEEVYGAWQVVNWVCLLGSYSLLIIFSIITMNQHEGMWMFGMLLFVIATLAFPINVFMIIYFYKRKKDNGYDYKMTEYFLSPLIFNLVYLVLLFVV